MGEDEDDEDDEDDKGDEDYLGNEPPPHVLLANFAHLLAAQGDVFCQRMIEEQQKEEAAQLKRSVGDWLSSITAI
jgi:hypothetical protein